VKRFITTWAVGFVMCAALIFPLAIEEPFYFYLCAVFGIIPAGLDQ